MYPVSEAFLRAVQENTRKYYWTGKITTKAGVEYPFGYEDIVKGSGYITAQCCGSTEIELGTVYAAEMGITLFSQIDRYTLEDAKVELFCHLRTAHCLELKAYDYMLRFEKNFNGFETVGNFYAFLALCCKAYDVELAHTQAEMEAMPNGAKVLSVYPENDIETYRDVLHFVAQVLGGFFCINREGKLELRKYGNAPFDSDTIGNPALDLGDVLTFTGGQADGERLTCITSFNCKIGGKQTLKCVGKNPRLSQAKSKNDKNISGLLNQIEAGKIGIHTFTNASAYSMAQADVRIISIEFASKEEARVRF